MKKIINKYLTKRNIVLILIMIIGFAGIINYAYFEPIYINSSVSSKVYYTSNSTDNYIDFGNLNVDEDNKVLNNIKIGESIEYIINNQEYHIICSSCCSFRFLRNRCGDSTIEQH